MQWKLVQDCRSELGEGPLWHDDALWWVNIMTGSLNRLTRDRGVIRSRSIGGMLGAAYAVTGSLWLPIGLHLGWNVTIVAIFGTIPSGSHARHALVTATTDGPVWLTGGAFGPEASVIAVLICSVATAALLITARRRRRIVAGR